MPTNSQILIDGFISDEFSKQTEYSSKGDYFELLASSRYMAPYDLDDDEIAEGLIGGSRDGGCDAMRRTSEITREMFQSTKESGKRWSILAKTISGGSTTG